MEIDKKIILEKYTDFQIAELDDDLVGVFKALIEWMRVFLQQCPNLKFDFPEYPVAHYFKLNAHLPSMTERYKIRKLLGTTFQRSDITLEERLDLIYKNIITVCYVFHLPVEILLELSKSTEEITRDVSAHYLVKDGMSPNWIKEPSGHDFTQVLYR